MRVTVIALDENFVSTQHNRLADRGRGIIQSTARSTRIHATLLFHGVNIPRDRKLWAEPIAWA